MPLSARQRTSRQEKWGRRGEQQASSTLGATLIQVSKRGLGREHLPMALAQTCCALLSFGMDSSGEHGTQPQEGRQQPPAEQGLWTGESTGRAGKSGQSGTRTASLQKPRFLSAQSHSRGPHWGFCFSSPKAIFVVADVISEPGKQANLAQLSAARMGSLGSSVTCAWQALGNGSDLLHVPD